jgi:hypothetical protein
VRVAERIPRLGLVTSGPRRPNPPAFRPGLTLLIVYFGVFFVGFSLALVMPELWPLFDDAGTRSEEELRTLAAETAQRAIRGRLGIAFALAFLATAIGGWTGRLPGLRAKRPGRR